MILLGIGSIPRPERAAKHDAFPAREEHLRGANRKAIFAIRVAALVGKADIANAGAHVREVPGTTAVLVVRASCELPRNSRRVFDAAFGLAVALQEVMRRQR